MAGVGLNQAQPISVALELEELVNFLENGLKVLSPRTMKRRDGLKMSKIGVKDGSEF